MRDVVDGFVHAGEGGVALSDLLERVTALATLIDTHHKDEEENLFPYAKRELGGTDEEIAPLLAHHRALEAKLEDVNVALFGDCDIAEARSAFDDFRRIFDAHTLAEADYLAKRWDNLFPGEVMAG